MTGNVYVAKQPEVFTYDGDGNLANDGRFSYTWDGENRLIDLTSLSGAPTSSKVKLDFIYDSKSRRIQKMVSTNNGTAYFPLSTNKFLYDGWNLVAEAKPNNSLIRSYCWGKDLSGSIQGAGGVGGLLEISYYGSSTTNCFPVFDGNGNVAALINAADGTIVANYEYAAFGEPIRATGVLAKNNPFRFSTKYDDDESDLLYYGYRYYKSSTGTWPNKDPMQEQGGLNLYGFIYNIPTMAADTDGRQMYFPTGPGVQYPGPINYTLPPDAYIPPYARTLYINLSAIWSGILSKIEKRSVGDGFKISSSEKWGELFQGGYELEFSGDVSTCRYMEDKSSGLMFSGSVSISGLGGIGAGAEATGDFKSTKSPTGNLTVCKVCENNIKPIVGDLSLTASATAWFEVSSDYSLGKWDTSEGFHLQREWPTVTVSKGDGIDAFVGLKLSGSTQGSHAWKIPR